MSVSYTCSNPECGVTLKTPNRVAAGKAVKCPKCTKSFVPEPDTKPSTNGSAPAAGTFKFADDDAKKKPTDSAKKKPADGEKKKPAAPAPVPEDKKPDDDDEDAESVRRGYGVVGDTEAELEAAEKNKVKFGELADKHKKSARGPAIGLLVMPTNLLTAVGLILGALGIVQFVWGMWPLVFSDAPPGDEEIEDAIFGMFLGLLVFGWGGLICYGASQMQELASYTWAMVGSVLAVPVLVGIFGVIMLQDPKVKAGFEETEGGPEEDEDKDDEEDDDEEDDDDDDDDDDDEDKPRKGRRAKK